ncbi:GNAT family N-acetyltransferase [Nocardioides mesophilus]|uniref:GNAT family N-acetyltransferase n=1 Tax=Nocardioides mesophilus TaxID=433659 RepID=A0A7G9RFR4_9ACTN|nr:GNAT family N-acetyltransferase [Nocardioides mesophilus]QNN54439.1 GNAT family N-acetyltransferase [Nocardioides mesophilus]
MSRRLARLTLDTLADLPESARSCVCWELDPVQRARAVAAGDAAAEKEAWLSRVLLEWGSCGRVLYVDGDAAGFVVYAPPPFLPGAAAMPTAPPGEDAVLLSTACVFPQYAGGGLGRMLMQGVVKDLVKRGGIRAVEAFGDTRAPARGAGATGEPAAAHDRCVLPAEYLLRVGFKTQRAHPRYPRMRLEVKSAVTWRSEVESALERLLGAVRPVRHPTPARPSFEPRSKRPPG